MRELPAGDFPDLQYHQLTPVRLLLLESKPLLRRLDDAAVVFDTVTWQTHLLPPAAAVVADLVDELSESGPVTIGRISAAVRDELALDPDRPEMRELLRMLEEIGMLDR